MLRTARTLLVAAFVAGAGGCATTPRLGVDAVMVYVVRHAQAWKNVPDAPPDADPDALTPEGQAQARAAGRWLAERRPDALVTSDTGRTRATAQAIGEAVGLAPRVVAGFGPLRGPSLDRRVADWAAGRDPRPEGPDRAPGESMADGAARARAALERLVADGAEAVVIVTHGDVVAALIGEAAGTPPWERWSRHEVPPGSVSTLHWAHGTLSLVSQGHVP